LKTVTISDMNSEERRNAVSASSVLLCTYYKLVYRITYTYTEHEISDRDQSVKYSRGQSAEFEFATFSCTVFRNHGFLRWCNWLSLYRPP